MYLSFHPFPLCLFISSFYLKLLSRFTLFLHHLFPHSRLCLAFPIFALSERVHQVISFASFCFIISLLSYQSVPSSIMNSRYLSTHLLCRGVHLPTVPPLGFGQAGLCTGWRQGQQFLSPFSENKMNNRIKTWLT